VAVATGPLRLGWRNKIRLGRDYDRLAANDNSVDPSVIGQMVEEVGYLPFEQDVANFAERAVVVGAGGHVALGATVDQVVRDWRCSGRRLRLGAATAPSVLNTYGLSGPPAANGLLERETAGGSSP